MAAILNVKNSGGNQNGNHQGSGQNLTRPGGNNSGGKHQRGTPNPKHDPNFTCKKCGGHNIGHKFALIVVGLDMRHPIVQNRR